MGGSQGARGINQSIIKAAPAWKDFVRIIHFTGIEDEQTTKAFYEREGIDAYVAAFHHRMQEAYSAANFVIARSGAASLSEIAYFGLPSLLIPYPHAAEDHQTLNAKIFTHAEAASLLMESEITPALLANTVLEILRDAPQLAAMAAAVRRLAPADAASLIVDVLEQQCRN